MTSQWRHFPQRVLPIGTSLHRIHHVARSPEHYSRSGRQRFDAPAPSPAKYGVCYLGLEALTAYVEVVGRIGTVGAEHIASKRLSHATAERLLRMADLADPSVVGRYGVTLAHSTSDDYSQSQRLSMELHGAGFDGIIYRVRHDPQGQLEAAAVFDESAAGALRWRTTRSLPPSLVVAGRAYGIRVLPPLATL